MKSPLPSQQLRLRENQLFLILTIVIGIVAGLAAVLFTVAIEQTSHRLFGLAPSRSALLAVPPLMSLVTGVLLAKFFPDVRGSGVPQTEAAYHLSRGIIPGTGAAREIPHRRPVYRVGPLHGPRRTIRPDRGGHRVGGRPVVAACRPSASAIWCPSARLVHLAAAFNTPVAAVLFALEEIIGDMNAALLGFDRRRLGRLGRRRAIDSRQRTAVPCARLPSRAPGRAVGVRGAWHLGGLRVAGVLQGAPLAAQPLSPTPRREQGRFNRPSGASSLAPSSSSLQRSWASATSTSIRRSTAACCSRRWRRSALLKLARHDRVVCVW